jgi:enamine deaminase RidA (YjgF/YER057c/UK114 family)
VKRIVKVNGMIHSTPDFTDHPKVMNRSSDLMIALFGDTGKHAKSSIGVCSLPMNIVVEVEILVEVAPSF